MAQVAEYFTLREASAVAARISEHAREDIADALAVGRQKAEAAEALWSNGHTAEGLRLAVEGLHATLEAVPRYERATKPSATSGEGTAGEGAASGGGAGEGASDGAAASEAGETKASAEAVEASAKDDGEAMGEARLRPVLAQRGLSGDAIRAIADAAQKARTTPLPRLDADVGPTHADLYLQVCTARREVERALSYVVMSKAELAWTRAARIGVAALVGLVAIAALVLATRTPRRVDASASAVFADSPTFGAGNAVDGDPGTEWLLPDRAQGWVEARLSPPRHVARVTLLNAKNAPHFDRATRGYRLELYAGDRMLRSVDGEFPTYERDPRPVSHDFGLDDVDRVRFVVLGHHNLGAGLAELTIEE